MAQSPAVAAAGVATINVCTIQVGTTGTIGSLMTWELESMKHVKPATPLQPSPARRKHQSPPVSVPCGATPRRTAQLPRRSPANEASSSGGGHSRPGGIVINSRRSSNGSSSSGGDVAAIQKILTDEDVPKTRQTPRKNGVGGGRISTVLSGGRMERDGAKMKERGAEKKGQRHSFLVEVVDLKCNNPMSNRLKKLGFSKLSETIA